MVWVLGKQWEVKHLMRASVVRDWTYCAAAPRGAPTLALRWRSRQTDRPVLHQQQTLSPRVDSNALPLCWDPVLVMCASICNRYCAVQAKRRLRRFKCKMQPHKQLY